MRYRFAPFADPTSNDNCSIATHDPQSRESSPSPPLEERVGERRPFPLLRSRCCPHLVSARLAIKCRRLLLFPLLLLLSLLAASSGQIATQRQPNILVIVADDLGYGELSCQGNLYTEHPLYQSAEARAARGEQE